MKFHQVGDIFSFENPINRPSPKKKGYSEILRETFLKSLSITYLRSHKTKEKRSVI